VTEHHQGPTSLKGTALKGGFNSHFVVTNQDGSVYNRQHDFEENLGDGMLLRLSDVYLFS
jgi:hypothetical protein